MLSIAAIGGHDATLAVAALSQRFALGVVLAVAPADTVFLVRARVGSAFLEPYDDFAGVVAHAVALGQRGFLGALLRIAEADAVAGVAGFLARLVIHRYRPLRPSPACQWEEKARADKKNPSSSCHLQPFPVSLLS